MPAIDQLKFAVFDKSAFPGESSHLTGPSPYAETLTEGPSYIPPEKRQKPLKLSGALDEKYGQYKTENTPLLGTQFSKEVQIKDILKDENVLRDVAITISERGVVFFKGQDLTVDEQKEFVDVLGKLSGKPETSGLHIHPTAPAGGVIDPKTDLIDPEVSFIASRLYKSYSKPPPRSHWSSKGWHSDLTFEPVPSDYTSLKLAELPPTGGDTLWANGYALLEKFSPSFQAFLETLTATYDQRNFKRHGEEKDFELYSQTRGAPENVGDELLSIHPLVRTNPVTGWKTLYAVSQPFTRINELSPIESDLVRKFIHNTLSNSHDIQLRYKWEKNDVAIWDNRSTIHSATFDYVGFAERTGVRTVGIGERPYFDPNSKLQSEDYKKQETA